MEIGLHLILDAIPQRFARVCLPAMQARVTDATASVTVSWGYCLDRYALFESFWFAELQIDVVKLNALTLQKTVFLED